MPRPDDAPPLTRGIVLRSVVFTLAIALSALAVWLIVNNPTSVRRVQLGVLTGLWAAMLGAFAMFGTRRLHHPSETMVAAGPSGTELAVRVERAELERAEEAAARRAHEVRLENMLRREIQTTVTREVEGLRDEIAQLRGDLLEKVGGQLRLERIETTRVIGSDLEALQHELRELKYAARDTGELRVPPARPREPAPMRQIVEPARVRPVSRETADIEADVRPARVVREPERPAPPTAPAPAPVPAARVEPPAPPAPAPRVETTGPIRYSADGRPQPPIAPTSPAPIAATSPAPAPAPTPPGSVRDGVQDSFASLPRIRPFTEFELDPIEDESAYTGRRRRVEDAPNNGRHAMRASHAVPPAEEQPAAPAAPAGHDSDGGQRHRRADETGNDLLARLLAREGS